MNLINIIKKRVRIADVKNKRILFNTFFSLLIKSGVVFISLLLLPIYMGFFSNQEVLGLWFTALSVLSWVLTFDLGIGNGHRNYLVIAFANIDKI